MSDNITQPKPISGFAEWLPEVRAVELGWMDEIRRVFESYGFANIETPSVEEVRILAAKGEDADKEIYALRRLNAAAEEEGDARLALHFDLTVPLARYIALHYNALSFPFKRYQIQRVWRGERPQEGRFREFYQCDIDVIDNEKVSIAFDIELPQIMAEVMARLNIGRAQTRLSNRKVMEGFYRGMGIKDTQPIVRAVDKLDKIGGPDGLGRHLRDDHGLPPDMVERILSFSAIKAPDRGFVDQVRALGMSDELLDLGLSELTQVIDGLADGPHGQALVDLSIARGFDYYTGTVYEGKLLDFPNFPTIYGGGRYDNLVGSFLRRPLPGVGLSFGLTRIFAKLVKEGLIAPGAKSPAQVLIAYPRNLTRAEVHAVARALRQRGLRVESYHEPRKLEDQIKYALRKGIAYLWLPASQGAGHQVKDLARGSQSGADIENWMPPGSSVG